MTIAGMFTASCQTRTFSDFRPDRPQDLVNLLADTTSQFNPPAAVLAYDKLISMGTAVFPALIASLPDRRPACPCFQADTSTRTTVGDACLNIIVWQVEWYSYNKSGPSYLTRDNIAAWWQSHQQKTLPELQIEAIEWTIARVEADDAYRWRREQEAGFHTLTEMKASLRALKRMNTPSEASQAIDTGAN